MEDKNLNEIEKESLDTNESLFKTEDINKDDFLDIIGARRAYWSAIAAYFLYFLSYNVALIFLYDRIADQGLLNILIVILGLIPTFLVLNNTTKGKILEFDKNHLSFRAIIFFLGIIYILSFIFSTITEILMRVFNISSIDVTAALQSNFNPILLFYVVLLGPFLEELQFRGFYLNITKKYGAYSTIILTSLLFSFAHLNFMQGMGTLGIGLVLGYVGYFYSFRSAVILHILNNFIVMLIGFLGGGGAQIGTEEPIGVAIVGLLILSLIINSIIGLFNKHKRDEIKANLKFDQKERKYLTVLLTDPVFYVYIAVMVYLMVKFGSLV